MSSVSPYPKDPIIRVEPEFIPGVIRRGAIDIFLALEHELKCHPFAITLHTKVNRILHCVWVLDIDIQVSQRFDNYQLACAVDYSIQPIIFQESELVIGFFDFFRANQKETEDILSLASNYFVKIDFQIVNPSVERLDRFPRHKFHCNIIEMINFFINLNFNFPRKPTNDFFMRPRAIPG